MLEEYNKISEHYSSFFTDKYSFETIKELPFINKNKEALELISSINIDTLIFIKKINDVYNDNVFSLSGSSNYLKEYLSNIKKGQPHTAISKNLTKNFDQILTLANNLKIDCSDIVLDFKEVCNKSNEIHYFIKEFSDFITEFLVLENEIGFADESLRPFIVEEFLDLKKRYEHIFNNSKTVEAIDTHNVYNETLSNYERILINLKDRINKVDPTVINTMSDLYVINKGIMNTPVKDFLFDKEFNINIPISLTLTSSQKIQEIKIFDDNSFAYKENGTYKSVQDHKELENVLYNLEHSIIEYTLRKKPLIGKFFVDKCKDSFKDFGYLEQILTIIDTFTNNEQILKNNNFDIRIFKEKSFEAIDDNMHKIIRTHKIEAYALSIMSNKYKSLLDEKSLKLFEALMNQKISKQDLQSMVGKKIASIKSNEDFHVYLHKIKDHFSGFNKENILKKLTGLSIEPIINYNNMVVFEVKTFEDSKTLGSPAWCISRYSSYFEDYTSDGLRQFFLYDFNKNEIDNESMIGFTLYSNGESKTQHLKNDSYYNKSQSFEKIIDTVLYSLRDEFQLNTDKIKELESEFEKTNKILLKR